MTLTQTLEHCYWGCGPPQAEVCGLRLHRGVRRGPEQGHRRHRTERGWNLYVCGNGGMRPRHADLFATDLGRADPDPLHRPAADVLRAHRGQAATYLGLDGEHGRGLDYLKSVIIEDRLGIGAELEAMMEGIVGTWQCEWKSTLADPDKLKLFEAFVNRPEDETPPRREEGQWVPDIAIKEVV